MILAACVFVYSFVCIYVNRHQEFRRRTPPPPSCFLSAFYVVQKVVRQSYIVFYLVFLSHCNRRHAHSHEHELEANEARPIRFSRSWLRLGKQHIATRQPETVCLHTDPSIFGPSLSLPDRRSACIPPLVFPKCPRAYLRGRNAKLRGSVATTQ